MQSVKAAVKAAGQAIKRGVLSLLTPVPPALCHGQTWAMRSHRTYWSFKRSTVTELPGKV